MRKLEAYDLNWKEKEFVRILETNGFYYNKFTSQIESNSRNSSIPFLGHITHDKERGFSGYLIIYDDFEERDKSYPPAREAFSKLRKLAEEFE
jgi:hypothetical protein